MTLRRVVAGLAMIVAFAGTGALALAQTQSSDGDDAREAALGVDTTRDYPGSFLNTAEHYDRLAPKDSEPGPPIGPDEVHVPAGAVPEVFVQACDEQAAKELSLASDPLCRAVLLKDAGAIEAGVHKVADVKEAYDEWIKEDR